MAKSSATGDHDRARSRGGVARPTAGRVAGRGVWDAVLSRGNQRLLRALAIRAKRRVVAATDPREREADDIAKHAVGEPSSRAIAPRTTTCNVVQRKCAACAAGHPPCAECEEEELLLKRHAGSEGATPDAMLSTLGPGGALDDTTRAFMETRLGAELDDVRVHVGSDAGAAAHALDARAFTTGRDIVFGDGEYQPHATAGRELIAHELVHVLQQRAGTVARPAVQRQEHHGTDDWDGGSVDAGVLDGGMPYAGVPDSGVADASADYSAMDSVDASAPAYEFDPCTVDEAALDNRELLQDSRRAERYLEQMIAAHRRGEDQFYDYGNLLARIQTERAARARAGHIWLKADVGDVPLTLYRVESGLIPSTLVVNLADISAAASNAPPGEAVIVTPGQFFELLERLHIPQVSPDDYFARQPADARQPFVLPVPAQQAEASQDFTGIRPAITYGGIMSFAGGPLQGTPDSPLMSGLGMPPVGPLGIGGPVQPSLQTSYLWGQFGRPIVTAGPYAFNPNQVGGFQTDWRGDMGERLFAAQTPETLASFLDLNQVQTNAPLYDFFDPVSGEPISVKTQLPATLGGEASLASVQEAWGIAFGSGNPALRAQALALLQSSVDPTMTLDAMLLNTRFAVNPENVGAVQDSLELAIRRGQSAYEPILSALLRQASIQVRQRGGTIVTYSDFNTLYNDFTSGLVSEARYRTAVGELATRARTHVIPNAAGAETHLRPLLDFRSRFDFRGASDFAGFPDTAAGRQQARALQELYFRRIATPELMEAQLTGLSPIIGRSATIGGATGLATTALLGLPQTIRNWDTDPYAGRRYLMGVGLGGAGGAAQASADQLLQMGISRGGLSAASALSAEGLSVAPVSALAPIARFGGSTALGGIASGGITLGGMYLDESLFGTDYTPIDYWARTVRATASGTVAAGTGALATAVFMASAGGVGAGGACTVVVPLVGTVGCGAVGAVVGFGSGLVAYYVFDWSAGDRVESLVRESLGEAGCVGRR